MKALKFVVASLILALLGMGNAMADHYHHGPRVGFGVIIGPTWGPWYYPPPPYYPPVVIERAPPIYVEQQPAPPVATPQTNYWYYCPVANGYYPYVKECPGGWQKVLPQPPNQP